MAQIQLNGFDGQPAKPGSSRYKRYVETTGTTDAWELDVLDPLDLRDLVKASVALHFDVGAHRALRREVNEARESFLDLVPEALQTWIDEM